MSVADRDDSVIGRFLEHSRTCYFENDEDPEYYLGSADWMTRNLDDRVEAVTPVSGPAIRNRLEFNRQLLQADNWDRWDVPDGDIYSYAVRISGTCCRYLETENGAAGLLDRYYDRMDRWNARGDVLQRLTGHRRPILRVSLD